MMSRSTRQGRAIALRWLACWLVWCLNLVDPLDDILVNHSSVDVSQLCFGLHVQHASPIITPLFALLVDLTTIFAVKS